MRAADSRRRSPRARFRRPVERRRTRRVDTLMGFFESGRALRGFDAGIQYALARVLVDPQFIFRFEREPAERRAPGAVYRISDLGARVAAVVLPVEQHPGRRTAARRPPQAGCRDPAVLEQQTRRMLADPRARRAGRQPRRPVAAAAAARRRVARGRRSSTATCATRSAARPSCSSRRSCARTAASSI